jgi:hypothetical protein
LFLLTSARGDDVTITATLVDTAMTDLSVAEGVGFDSAAATLFVDPAVTRWIAWNDVRDVSAAHPSRPGELFLGPGGIGVDDFIRLTVSRVGSGESLTLDIDQNTGEAVSFGVQNVIFGSAAEAPDVFRDPGGFPGFAQFLDEAGSHNAIFTTAGLYEFQFSFRNTFASSADHPDVWLLQASVPEPTRLALGLAVGLIIVTHRGSTRRTYLMRLNEVELEKQKLGQGVTRALERLPIVCRGDRRMCR